jgi:dihydroneopterin aldolase/2-amino-4-hydroxy-6-hydroxymethyldihydropteridine diphosphokinase/dihydropteroate synthase
MVELMNGAFSSITINDLLVVLPQGIGLSAFSLPAQPCQILVSVTCHLLPHCLKPSVSNKDGVSDDWDTLGLGKSVNYSALSKSLLKRLNEATIEHDERVQSLEDLVEVIVSHCAAESPSSLERIDVKVERRRALLFSESVSVHTSVIVEYPQALEEETFPDYVGLRTSNRTFKINGIQADTIIGLNPHERLEKQRLEMDLEVDLGKLFGLGGNSSELAFDYKSLGQTALQVRLGPGVAGGQEWSAD